jgi:hypothetical protein
LERLGHSSGRVVQRAFDDLIAEQDLGRCLNGSKNNQHEERNENMNPEFSEQAAASRQPGSTLSHLERHFQPPPIDVPGHEVIQVSFYFIINPYIDMFNRRL